MVSATFQCCLKGSQGDDGSDFDKWENENMAVDPPPATHAVMNELRAALKQYFDNDF